ncbi:MAG: 50S ribosomal protein L3 [Candidatus Shapirobacteria bacterium]
MINGFICQKIGMTNTYDASGKRLAITRFNCAPLPITQVKTQETDKYQALQIAYGTKKRQTKATLGRLAKIKLEKVLPLGFMEFKPTDPEATFTTTQLISIDQVFTAGDKVDVQGVSKGRGFAGVIKRWGFRRQPVSGGQSDRVRAPGSIGAQTPGKVLKGKKMPGHMGNKNVTIENLVIHKLDPQANLMEIVGSVPGPIHSWVILQKSK